jgi:DNA processing protein
LEDELEALDRFKSRLVPFFSDEYPSLLKHLGPSAPVLLRVRGEYLPQDRLAVALVGSRRCSLYGRKQAGRFSCDLAGMGFTIVSGLAWGIDQAAHRGAIAAGGRTLAVLGCGLDQILGGREAELALDIADKGALISELPMGTPGRAGNFPARNRIISGLSLGVVVVEAASRSGSLITARLAAEQGRAVFAVPGPVDSSTSRGTHALIRDGAVLVESATDVADGLGPLDDPLPLPRGGREAEVESQPLQDPRVLALNERERAIYDLLSSSPIHIDQVLEAAGLPISMVSATLLTLEIRGIVTQHPGQLYARAV